MKGGKMMKKISLNIPAEVLSHIEWSKIYLRSQAPINYTTTQVIIYAIEKLYSELWNESNKMDSIKKKGGKN